MPSERIQRRIDSLLDEAEASMSAGDWSAVAEKARAVLAMDADNEDAPALLRAAEANLGTPAPAATPPSAAPTTAAPTAAPPAVPESFAAGRYHVRKFLGEGGKKRVFLAHDALLDRDVAFALIKTDGLDDVGRERITREAQAMGRMGAHPHMVSVFDLGDEGGAPYIVTELMGGGDVEGEIEQAGGALALPRALEIATGVARGLVFAHSQGIVHRDLKPGNVWLTKDGVAKIGDFGLAVAQGRSRLTQHGLMVGTFGYMPPEQALGGEATPQSDLYSLGAMLYEMVTGKPPFTGDTPTAVISQHLNTPPVAPSWHTEHCPPPLEDLILALLAKEPSQRPASATEVLRALEGIDPSEPSRSRSDSAANPLDRLASGVFVGRERELERLRASLDGALAGRGSLVMLVGEPGIGKTRTTQELETYARMRGAKVLWGRANENAGAPPYWPWVQVGRAYRDQTEDKVRRRQYEPYAVELQRILPGLHDLFPSLPPPPDGDAEGGQFRLYDALASFLIAASSETPLVVVLDDLHWADSATLAMLTHLTRELARSHILVVGTYRDTDLDRRHPLSQALADLNREDLFTRIPLRGLTLSETTAYISRTTGVTAAPAMAQRIHEETEGNPFFLAEVVNLMAEEGTLSAPLAEVQIPEGVRQALGRRLDRLSEEANALLTTLAVVGREFDHALVLVLSAHDATTTLKLVEEALRARVLEETGTTGRYRFRHALMQQTLLEELSVARQVLLHGQVADALLATYGPDNRDHLPELAEHYAESAMLNPAHARLAASTLRRAAEATANALAWDEAARLYERCLDLVTAAPDRLGEDEGLLWRDLAMARIENFNAAPAWEAFGRAAALLESRADELAPAALRIALLVAIIGMRPGLPVLRRLAAATGASPSLAAYQFLAALACAENGPEGDGAAERARAIGDALGVADQRVEYLLRRRESLKARDRGDFTAFIAEYEALRPLATALGAIPSLLGSLAVATLRGGDLDRAARLWAEATVARRAAGEHTAADLNEVLGARVAWRREGPLVLATQLDRLPPGGMLDLLRAEMALEAGESAEAWAALPAADHPLFAEGSPVRGSYLGLRCRVLLARGDLPAARTAFAAWRDDFDQNNGFNRTLCLAPLDDALIALGDRALLEQVADTYDSWTQWRSGYGGTDADYLRGAIALTLDRVDDAERWFRTGLEWAQQWGVDTVAGRNLYGLAEVAERRGDHALAMEHLDAAGALFAKRGAKLYLDQVIAKKQILKA